MRYISIIAVILLFAFGALAQNGIKVGSPAPSFSAATLDGSFVDIDALRGKVVVITFWSTKCEICRHEIPSLNAFKNRFEGREVVFLALTMENGDRVQPFLKSNPFAFQIIPDSFGMVLKYADRDRQGNINMGFPSYFLIDTDGSVAHRSSGWDKIGELDQKIDRLLSAK
jgi:peroxiredoxin